MSSAEKRQALLTPEEKNNLLNRWLKANPQQPAKEEVYILLEEKYGAYQLPLPIWNQTATTVTKKYERTQ